MDIHSSKIQGPLFSLRQAHIPQDHKLNKGAVTAAQTAFDLNLFNEFK